MINKKRKKIFYVPGMISLIFIPLLCLAYFYKTNSFTVFGGMDLTLSDDESFLEYKVPSLRKYKEFVFNASKSNEKNKFNELQSSLRELVKNTDIINGAKVHFGAKTDYDVFVSVIDILNIEKVPIWMLYKNDIWIIIPSKSKYSNLPKLNLIICGYVKANKDYWLKIEKEKKRDYIVSLYKNQWILFLGYFGIVLLNIFALVKFNKNR
jgi:hypothetical protein